MTVKYEPKPRETVMSEVMVSSRLQLKAEPLTPTWSPCSSAWEEGRKLVSSTPGAGGPVLGGKRKYGMVPYLCVRSMGTWA